MNQKDFSVTYRINSNKQLNTLICPVQSTAENFMKQCDFSAGRLTWLECNFIPSWLLNEDGSLDRRKAAGL